MSESRDPIEHPPHYTRGAIEAIAVIEDWQLGYHLGNTIKYLCRAGFKDPTKEVEDLKKAAWYLERYIRTKESGDGDTTEASVRPGAGVPASRAEAGEAPVLRIPDRIACPESSD